MLHGSSVQLVWGLIVFFFFQKTNNKQKSSTFFYLQRFLPFGTLSVSLEDYSVIEIPVLISVTSTQHPPKPYFLSLHACMDTCTHKLSLKPCSSTAPAALPTRTLLTLMEAPDTLITTPPVSGTTECCFIAEFHI